MTPTGTANPAVGQRRVTCPKCDHVQKNRSSKCEDCGHDLTKLRKAMTRQVREDAWGGKPGPNAAQVGPHARKKLSGLVRHYMKKPHPFSSCVRDNTKRFGPDRAKRVCAVLKDIGRGTTKWRKGGGKVREEDVQRTIDRIIEAGADTPEGVDAVRAFLLEQVRTQPPAARIALAEETEERLELLATLGRSDEVDEEWQACLELLEAADLPRYRKPEGEGRKSPRPSGALTERFSVPWVEHKFRRDRLGKFAHKPGVSVPPGIPWGASRVVPEPKPQASRTAQVTSKSKSAIPRPRVLPGKEPQAKQQYSREVTPADRAAAAEDQAKHTRRSGGRQRQTDRDVAAMEPAKARTPQEFRFKGKSRRPWKHDELEENPNQIMATDPRGKWDKERARRDAARLRRADHRELDTQRMFKPGGKVNEGGKYEGGEYTPERRELHKAIVRQFLRGLPQDVADREILFMAGGPASGKSTMLREGVTTRPDGSVLVNPDAVKGMLPEYREMLSRSRDFYSATKVHQESSDVAAMVMEAALARRMNVTVDSSTVYPDDVKRVQAMGYKARAAVATVEVRLAQRRSTWRGDAEGRYVPDEVLLPKHAAVARDFESWVKQTKIPFTLVDTRRGTVIATAENGELDIKAKTAYRLFQRRAAEIDDIVDPRSELPVRKLRTRSKARAAKAKGAEREDERGFVDVGADVNKAADLLAQGKKVKLDQPRSASVLLSELARRVQAAKDAGDKAPNFDLCKVTVRNTNLFCAESKGIPRVKMPQLSGKPTPGSAGDALPKDDRGEINLAEHFREMLAMRGIKVSDERQLASFLRASQIELNGGKVAGMTKALEAGRLPPGRLFVSSDDYIVDGHHRWAANIGVDIGDNKLGDVEMDIARVNMTIIELLDEANRFAAEWGIPQAAV